MFENPTKILKKRRFGAPSIDPSITPKSAREFEREGDREGELLEKPEESEIAIERAGELGPEGSYEAGSHSPRLETFPRN